MAEEHVPFPTCGTVGAATQAVSERRSNLPEEVHEQSRTGSTELRPWLPSRLADDILHAKSLVPGSDGLASARFTWCCASQTMASMANVTADQAFEMGCFGGPLRSSIYILFLSLPLLSSSVIPIPPAGLCNTRRID